MFVKRGGAVERWVGRDRDRARWRWRWGTPSRGWQGGEIAMCVVYKRLHCYGMVTGVWHDADAKSSLS
jgi:hypothetical protein